ncbi:RNA polymerase sigma-54 factor RpoN [plant metagenome]|uniref:RNA polymerase sigma factor n=2 Tax=root TaxID=1 RepID=A0A1C3K2G9_9BURK|nr:RNA polymerase sigma factor [Orrella dioscoreae]SBT25634.1 RNA polymerase sigma-54 factor RpoN [Orrella dioscoreae]SOE47054.1 RNA polymerase sigma-54 factor RpoN [Orrella dioscoreae]
MRKTCQPTPLARRRAHAGATAGGSPAAAGLMRAGTQDIRVEPWETAESIYDLLPETLPALSRFALRMTGHPHDAEDLVQRTCVRALECGHQLRPGSSARSWLYAIMYSLWMNELRARQTHGGEHAPWDDALAAPCDHGPDTELQYRQTVEMLERLPEQQRAVLRLVAMEGFGYKEAAQRLQLPIGTVTSRLARARAAIDRMLGANGLETPATRRAAD